MGALVEVSDLFTFLELFRQSDWPRPAAGYGVAPAARHEPARLNRDKSQREHGLPDAARIAAEMKQAAEWARRRRVPVVCDEFGVYREFADPADRAAWLHDVRTALEHEGIGWTMWDYAGSFGVVTKKDGKAVADDGVLRALGMK